MHFESLQQYFHLTKQQFIIPRPASLLLSAQGSWLRSRLSPCVSCPLTLLNLKSCHYFQPTWVSGPIHPPDKNNKLQSISIMVLCEKGILHPASYPTVWTYSMVQGPDSSLQAGLLEKHLSYLNGQQNCCLTKCRYCIWEKRVFPWKTENIL